MFLDFNQTRGQKLRDINIDSRNIYVKTANAGNVTQKMHPPQASTLIHIDTHIPPIIHTLVKNTRKTYIRYK